MRTIPTSVKERLAKLRETIEKYRRLDFGHMELQMTIDDPKTYTKPWTVTAIKELRLEDDVLEYVCLENERDSSHIIRR